MKIAPKPLDVENYKKAVVEHAAKIANELRKREDRKSGRKSKPVKTTVQQNFSCLDQGFNPSDELWTQLCTQKKGPTLWDFVHTLIRGHLGLPVSYLDNVHALVKVVREGLDPRSGEEMVSNRPKRANHDTIGMVLALPASILNQDVVEKFLESRLRLAEYYQATKQHHLAQMTLRTAVNTVRRARWFFTADKHEFYDFLKLKLPRYWHSFMTTALLETETISYQAPSLEQFRKLCERMPGLAEKDPPVYQFIMLTLWGGLRAAEAMAARVEWVIDSTEELCINVRPEADFMVKTGQSRKAWITQGTFVALKKQSGAKYIVADSEKERIRAYEATLALLEEIGFDDSKQVHYLRRFYYSAVAHHLGLEKAKLSAGHHSLQVGFQYYLFESFAKELFELWLLGPWHLCHRSGAMQPPSVA